MRPDQSSTAMLSTILVLSLSCIGLPPGPQPQSRWNREQGISAGDSAQAAIQADFRLPCLTYNQLSPMSYQVLARKYRPQKFSEVIGQEHVTRTLKNAIEQGRTAHGYIFSRLRGIGKTTVARILA